VVPLCLYALVFSVAVAVALYWPAADYAGRFFWLPFLPAMLTLGSALVLLNGGFGGPPMRLWRAVWDVLVSLPGRIQAGLGPLGGHGTFVRQC
jgi:hypothetical protein